MPNDASDFYGGRRNTGFAKPAKKNQTANSPVTGQPLSYNLEYLDGGPALFDKLFKSIYNQRSADTNHLTRADVNDIFDDIKAANGNTFEVVGVKGEGENSGKIELLAGLRRAFTCSLLPGSKLYIKVFDSLTDAEKIHFAISSDQYNKPNPINRGFSLLALEQALKDQGKPSSTRDLAQIYGISTGSVSEYKNYAKQLPPALFTLFPGLGFIEVRFLRSMLAHKDHPDLATVLANCDPVIADFEQGSDEKTVKQACQNLQRNILKQLKSDPEPVQCRWRDVKAGKGFKVKVDAQGKVTLSFSESTVAPDKLEQLLALVSQN